MNVYAYYGAYVFFRWGPVEWINSENHVCFRNIKIIYDKNIEVILVFCDNFLEGRALIKLTVVTHSLCHYSFDFEW